MSVQLIADVAQLAEYAAALTDNDVLICHGWRITRSMDGTHFWIERNGVLRTTPIDQPRALARHLQRRLPAHSVRLALIAFARTGAVSTKQRALLVQRHFLTADGRLSDEGRACLAVLTPSSEAHRHDHACRY